ncbi:MAG: hypothetical protein JWP10_734, partial [Nocardioidaceae bacterium]|nr:hypothetical protein [Nocardioidaceae bacterium]
MKRLAIFAVGIVAAVVPTVWGVHANTSLDTTVPVKPVSAIASTTPTDGPAPEPTAEPSESAPTSSPTPKATPTPYRGKSSEGSDDNGGNSGSDDDNSGSS